MPAPSPTTSPEIAHLTRMLRRVSEARTPQESSLLFGQLTRELHPIDGFCSVSRRGLGDGQYKITRAYLKGDLPTEQDTANPWRDWNKLELHRGGFIGEVIARDEPQYFPDLNISDDPVLGDAIAGFGTCAAFPVFDDGEALNWAFSFQRKSDGIPIESFIHWLLTINLNGRATKNLVTIQEVEKLNNQLAAQLERVARIQQSLLPERTPCIPGLAIATSYLTSNESGGDYYDFFDLGSGRWGVFIGDVSGHGAGAATVTAMANALLHAQPPDMGGPADTLAWLNKHMAAKRIESSFMTAFYGVYDANDRTFTGANAGHPAPRQMQPRASATIPIVGASAPPLGVLERIMPEETVVPLGLGDTLVLYTDGVTEAFGGADGRTMFGLSRLDATLSACTGEPPCVIDSIHAALHAHTGAMTRDDDQTIVALKVTNEAAPDA
ncbi:MAG: PP2C family protein-serine/threonine phosphatase [Phycisphaeraceae bacterium]|nr:PP2C family protein-serine/threonine phosphatase [Phycisphaeraceae bacterium]